MHHQTDRRSALKLLVAAPLGLAATTALPGSALAQARDPVPRVQAHGGPVEPSAGSWHTWLLTSGSELRLAPPPDAQAELAELHAIAARRDSAALDRVSYWDAGAPAYRWTERAVKHIMSKGVAGLHAQRMPAPPERGDGRTSATSRPTQHFLLP